MVLAGCWEVWGNDTGNCTASIGMLSGGRQVHFRRGVDSLGSSEWVTEEMMCQAFGKSWLPPQ